MVGKLHVGGLGSDGGKNTWVSLQATSFTMLGSEVSCECVACGSSHASVIYYHLDGHGRLHLVLGYLLGSLLPTAPCNPAI